MSNVQDGNN